jgi:hypothetical protein
MVDTVIRVTWTWPISKPGILTYPGFPIRRVLHQPPPGLLSTSWFLLIWPVLGFEESVPFDPSGNPVPLVFFQLSLIFFNQHSRCRFYSLSWLLQHVLLPHANLRVVGLDHLVAQFIENDQVLALGRLGLIRAHQNLLVHELDNANEEWVCVEFHLASTT